MKQPRIFFALKAEQKQDIFLKLTLKFINFRNNFYLVP